MGYQIPAIATENSTTRSALNHVDPRDEPVPWKSDGDTPGAEADEDEEPEMDLVEDPLVAATLLEPMVDVEPVPPVPPLDRLLLPELDAVAGATPVLDPEPEAVVEAEISVVVVSVVSLVVASSLVLAAATLALVLDVAVLAALELVTNAAALTLVDAKVEVGPSAQ